MVMAGVPGFHVKGYNDGILVQTSYDHRKRQVHDLKNRIHDLKATPPRDSTENPNVFPPIGNTNGPGSEPPIMGLRDPIGSTRGVVRVRVRVRVRVVALLCSAHV